MPILTLPLPVEITLTTAEKKEEEEEKKKEETHLINSRDNTTTAAPPQKTTIIGTWELAHCPCCNNKAPGHARHVQKETILNTTTSLLDQCEIDDDANDDDNDEESSSDSSEDEEELFGLEHSADESYGLVPGTLEDGTPYTPTQILVQGWLHKKGTGKDWIKSRAWKARWGRLVWAKVEGYGAIEVPLLLMYWYPSSKTASTAIVLGRQVVVVAVDYAADPTAWNANRLEIRQVVGDHDDDDDTTTAVRTFSAANRAERDEWVYAMAQALLDYSKSKQVHDRAAATAARSRPLSPPPPESAYMPATRPISPAPQRPRSPVPINLPKSPRSMQRKIAVNY